MAADYLGDLQGLLSGYLEGGGLRVYVKTNYGPEIPIYAGGKSDGGGSVVGDLVGVRAQVIVRDAKGKTIKTIGDPAPTDPIRVTVLLAILGLVGFVVVRGVIK